MSDLERSDVFAAIVRRLFPAGTLARHSPLAGGVCAEVHVLEVEVPEGDERRVVVRWLEGQPWKPQAEGGVATEFGVMQALHAAGLAVPQPLLLDRTNTVLPVPFMVMEWMPGASAVDEEEVSSAVKAMARFLVDLHALDVSSLSLPAVPRREDPIEGLRDYLPKAYEELGQVLRDYELRPDEDALVHGDFWPGNVMWHEGELLAVIDWEDAAIGSPLSDVACCRAELAVAYGDEAVHWFTEAYWGQAACPAHDLAVWDLYVASAALATMHEWGLASDVESHRRARTTAFVDRAAAALLQRQPERRAQ